MICSRYGILGLVFALAVLISCAPQVAPAPAPPAPPPVAAPALSPEEAAWAQVVAAARKERVLTIYSDDFVADIGRSLAEAFQNKYGIKVEILPSMGRASVSRIKVEHKIGKPIADILQTGTSSSTELVVDGLGESVVGELPAMRDKGVFIFAPTFSPGGEILYFSPQVNAPLINTKLVPPQDEPKSWYDLLDPKWKGKMQSTDPRGGSTSTFVWWTVSRYYKVLDDDYWRRLAPQLAYFDAGIGEIYRMIARGEYPMSIGGTDTTTANLIAEGAPLKNLAMKEGQSVAGRSITTIKGGPHPNAAKLFMNWLFTSEGQEVFAKAASVGPIRKDVPNYMHPGARVVPIKAFPRTWEVAQAGNEWHRAGVTEQIFGKK